MNEWVWRERERERTERRDRLNSTLEAQCVCCPQQHTHKSSCTHKQPRCTKLMSRNNRITAKKIRKIKCLTITKADAADGYVPSTKYPNKATLYSTWIVIMITQAQSGVNSKGKVQEHHLIEGRGLICGIGMELTWSQLIIEVVVWIFPSRLLLWWWCKIVASWDLSRRAGCPEVTIFWGPGMDNNKRTFADASV